MSAAAPILAVPTGLPHRRMPTAIGYAGVVVLAALAGGVAAGGNGADATAVGLARAVIVGVPLAVGFHAWHTRRAGRFGALLMLLGLAWFLATFAEADQGGWYLFGRVAGWSIEVLFVYVALAFPRGRLTERDRPAPRRRDGAGDAAALLAAAPARRAPRGALAVHDLHRRLPVQRAVRPRQRADVAARRAAFRRGAAHLHHRARRRRAAVAADRRRALHHPPRAAPGRRRRRSASRAAGRGDRRAGGRAGPAGARGRGVDPRARHARAGRGLRHRDRPLPALRRARAAGSRRQRVHDARCDRPRADARPRVRRSGAPARLPAARHAGRVGGRVGAAAGAPGPAERALCRSRSPTATAWPP